MLGEVGKGMASGHEKDLNLRPTKPTVAAAVAAAMPVAGGSRGELGVEKGHYDHPGGGSATLACARSSM